jgi:hypothetical protein
MTAAERQQRMRLRRQDEVVSLRNEIKALKGRRPARKAAAPIEVPPVGDMADQAEALKIEVQEFFLKFERDFTPKFKAWRSLKPPKSAREELEGWLHYAAMTLLEHCPSVQDYLAEKDRLLTELVEEQDARIAELKSGADDEIIGMIVKAQSDREQRIALYAGLVEALQRAQALPDFVRALTPATRERLSAVLADRRRGPRKDEKPAAKAKANQRYSADLNQSEEAADAEEFYGEAPTPEQRWQYSLGNLCGDTIARIPYWDKHFPGWERFDLPPQFRKLLVDAMAALASINSTVAAQPVTTGDG